MRNLLSMEGMAVVVTGAAQGIGKAIADISYELGASVITVDVNREALVANAKDWDPARVLVQNGSVADHAFVESTMEEAVKKFGKVNGLVNCAGIIRPAMIEKMTDEQWKMVIDINLSGCYYFIQAFGRLALKDIKAGNKDHYSIVNISSVAGRMGTIGQINYSAAKSGLFGITMSTAREWSKFDIRSNCVCYGVVETPMTEVARGEKFKDLNLAKIPMARFSSPEEAAIPVCFLLSNASSYITGQVLNVDGGYFMAP